MISASNCQTLYKKITRIVKGPILRKKGLFKKCSRKAKEKKNTTKSNA